MNVSEAEILRIIKRALDPEFTEPLSPEIPWDIVYKIGTAHKITPLLYEGISEAEVDPEIKKTFLNDYKYLALIHYGQMDRLDAITKAFDKTGIDYMLLKGRNLKALYPKPEMRVMSDLDILIKLPQYNLIKECLTSLGLHEDIETAHEIKWTDGRFAFVELHKRLIPPHNHDFHDYFGTGWDKAKPLPDGGYAMSFEDELVFIFTHFAKHYRDGGTGIRNMIDLYLFEKIHCDINIEYVKEELEKLGLLKFYENVRLTLGEWFDGLPGNAATSLITDRVFKSGIYGTDAGIQVTDALKSSNKYNGTTKGKLVFALKVLFPPVRVVKLTYPLVEKLPFLLPLFWVMRGLKTVLFKKSALKAAFSGFKRMNKKTVSKYRSELDAVGLNSEF